MSTAGLDRRLEKLEAQQPRVPSVVGTARRWAAEWNSLGPCVAVTVEHLRAQWEARFKLEQLDQRLLVLTDAFAAQAGPELLAALHMAVLEIAG